MLINVVVTTTSRLRFDFDSTTIRLLFARSQWRNTSAAADPLAAVTLICAAAHTGGPPVSRNAGRGVGRS